MKNSKGFTILEVVISIAIISIAILSMIAMYISMMKSSSKGTEMTIATSISERVAGTIDKKILSEIKAEQKNGDKEIKIYKTKDIINGKPYYCITELKTLTDDYFKKKYIIELNVFVFWNINTPELINSIVVTNSQDMDKYLQNNKEKFTHADRTGLKYIKFKRLIMLSND